MIYQLQNLSPPEFTELVADLLSSEHGSRLSKTPDGPDGGIDLLRAGHEQRPEIVVQCKHYFKSSFSTLKRDLKGEVDKVHRINPVRYIVATSQELTTKRKEEIAGQFSGFISTVDDVLGGQDIRALLRNHPKVERNHYKLWLGSTALLTKIIHQGTSVWQEQLLARLDEHKQVYVQTPSFREALEILNSHRIVLVAGGPGVGKTTLANVLSATLVADGFEFREIIDLEHDIRDLPDEGNVVLYYDDFLGHSVWRDTRPGSERRLENLIRLAERSERFWLILTTRTYLLEDARKVSTAVEQRLNKKHEIVLHVDKLSRSTRARILYNHLFFNNVPPEACRSLMDWKRLGKILDHPNFNPRIIEYVTKSLPEDLSPTKYVDFIEQHLQHPSRLYEAAIKDRIGAEARDILFVVHVLGEAADITRVYRVWKALRLEVDKISENKEVFDRKVKALDANLISLTKLHSWSEQQPRDGLLFYNPGVGEMVRDLLWSYDDRWTWFCMTAETGTELVHLARCNLKARPTAPGLRMQVTLPSEWYDRWITLVREGVGDLKWLAKSLGESSYLRVWDGHIPQLIRLLEDAHNSKWSTLISWTQLGAESISESIQAGLRNLSWLGTALLEEVEDFVRDQRNKWDLEDSGDLYLALDRLGAIASSAAFRLQEAGIENVKAFLARESSSEEIDEDDYYDATSLNQGLELGLDVELAGLEDRVRYRKPSVQTQVFKPQLGDDPMTEAEVKALFESLARKETSANSVSP